MNQERKKFVNRIREGIDQRAEEDVKFEETNKRVQLTEEEIEERVGFFSELIDSNLVKRVFSEREER